MKPQINVTTKSWFGKSAKEPTRSS